MKPSDLLITIAGGLVGVFMLLIFGGLFITLVYDAIKTRKTDHIALIILLVPVVLAFVAFWLKVFGF